MDCGGNLVLDETAVNLVNCEAFRLKCAQQRLRTDYPQALMPLPTQIAGHGSEADGQRAILKREDGKLLKPVQAPPKGQREVDFYEKINESTDETDLKIIEHIPKFYGIENVHFTNGVHRTERFLVLHDITEGFSLPNVIDVKIGARTWGPDASDKKIAQESSKYVGTKIPFGFSVTGMIVHDIECEGDRVKLYDKSFGRNLKTEDVKSVPRLFFSGGPPAALAKLVVEKIRAILAVFEGQRKYTIYASSLLLAYDARAARACKRGTIDAKKLEESVNIRVIDFAHVFPSEGKRDDNFLHGLENLSSLFTEYLKELQQTDE